MATNAMLVLISLIGLLLLVVVWRAFFSRRRQLPPAPRPDYNLITVERIEGAFARLRRSLERQPLTRGTLPHHGYPDARQWLILLQETPQEAADLIKVLRMQAAVQGAFVDTIIIDSIIEYEAAQQYLQTYGPVPVVQGEPAPAPATIDTVYPNEQEWRRRLAQNRQEAIQSLYHLELQQARFGPSAPPMLQASITAFRRAERDTKGDPNSS